MLSREDWYEKAYGCLIGLSVADALGAPTEGMSVYEIKEQFGWIDNFVSDDPVGTDDTEYAMLTAKIILKYGKNLSYEHMTKEWFETLADQKGFKKGGFSEVCAINNLRKGLKAPHTGTDNHQLWSDGVAMRIAPIGIYSAGDPEEAVRLAEIEARVSHDRDGVYCGQALAASVAYAMTGSAWEEVIQTGLNFIPRDSWTYRKIDSAVEIGLKYSNVQDAVEELYNKVSIFYYPWADMAPEATALAYGVFAAAKGDYIPAVLGGTNVGRDSDTIAAMNGAMAGALHGARAVPVEWQNRINIIRGVCIQATAGMDVREISAQFADALVRRGSDE
ncbi:ADP-ribosylglycohydrolase family protein [Bacillus horti]|uniref:ADP-ribosylglycohydrolase n=1 Tax=Caldalkalibacillus horti TaxID=77523 RepID=A0ABT9W347_9BACI|nr:ADP-ribosylglycohydrolase family protein [Bacillus horti]MDQ0167676.1 ADP-ribosylglycohydrolase [Bacillus horti]